MFDKATYVGRRAKLRELMKDGIIILFGNNESPCNYLQMVTIHSVKTPHFFIISDSTETVLSVLSTSITAQRHSSATISTLKISCGMAVLTA